MNSESLPPNQREQLRKISGQLLRLHKSLLDRERVSYEQSHDAIASPGEFLNLVLTHQSFEWLRQLSGLIVQIDEMLAPRSVAGKAEAESALIQTRQLLTLSEDGTLFQRNYWKAAQSSPDILIAHKELMKELSA